ncbi:MAG: hypothetical protein ABR562_00400 [Thermoplasmatota archaeon]
MKALALAAVLATVIAAGCANPPPLPDSNTLGPQDQDLLETIPVTGHVFSPGSVPDQEGCPAPLGANPNTQCDTSATVFVQLTGTLNGTETDAGHFAYAADGSASGAGLQVFAGTIAGCGSGVLRMTYVGGAAALPNPDHQGDLDGFDNLTLVPGSQTAGFAGVVDVHLLMTFHINPVTFAAEGETTGSVICRPSAVPHPAAPQTATAFQVAGSAYSPGILTYDQVDCAHRTSEQQCEVYFTEIVNMTGDVAGVDTDTGHGHFHNDGTAEFWADETFSGTIKGCGSGTLTFREYGAEGNTPDPMQQGSLPANGTWRLLPGSQTTGFAGVVDARLDLRGTLNPFTGEAKVKYTGTVWCNPTPSPTFHSGTKVNIVATGWTPGALAPDSNVCGLPSAANPTDACTTGAHEILFPISGNLNGTLVDTGFFHYNTDLQASADVDGFQVFTGSIPGCGSGSMTFTYKGHFVSSPDPTKLGYENGYDNLTYVQGSGTQGFAGVTGGWILEDGEINQITYAATGKISGEVWCTMPTVAAEAVAARESSTTSPPQQGPVERGADESPPAPLLVHQTLK